MPSAVSTSTRLLSIVVASTLATMLYGWALGEVILRLSQPALYAYVECCHPFRRDVAWLVTRTVDVLAMLPLGAIVGYVLWRFARFRSVPVWAGFLAVWHLSFLSLALTMDTALAREALTVVYRMPAFWAFQIGCVGQAYLLARSARSDA